MLSVLTAGLKKKKKVVMNHESEEIRVFRCPKHTKINKIYQKFFFLILNLSKMILC